MLKKWGKSLAPYTEIVPIRILHVVQSADPQSAEPHFTRSRHGNHMVQ